MLACFAVLQTLVSHYAQLDPEVWAAVDALVIVLIGAIAYEDAAAKSAVEPPTATLEALAPLPWDEVQQRQVYRAERAQRQRQQDQ